MISTFIYFSDTSVGSHFSSILKELSQSSATGCIGCITQRNTISPISTPGTPGTPATPGTPKKVILYFFSFCLRLIKNCVKYYTI